MKSKIILVCTTCLMIQSSFLAVAQTGDKIEAARMLGDMVAAYRNEIPKEMTASIQFNVLPAVGSWHLEIREGQVALFEEGINMKSKFIFYLDLPTLKRLWEGSLSPLTAAGRARMTDPAPLNMLPGEGYALSAEWLADLLEFTQRFFNRFEPEKIVMSEKNTRLIHGADVVALFYGRGVRSSWYLIKKGRKLNEPGDTNPFPQGVIVIKGAGRAKICTETIEIKAGEAYYIPPGCDHVIWTESDQPLEIIWIAWGEGA